MPRRASTQVTALPKTHTKSLTKPDKDEFKLYLINLSNEDLETQCVRNASLPDYSGAETGTIKYP